MAPGIATRSILASSNKGTATRSKKLKTIPLAFTDLLDVWTLKAASLLLWRAADCGINGVSDAVYKSKLPGAKNVMRPSVWVKRAANISVPMVSLKAGL